MTPPLQLGFFDDPPPPPPAPPPTRAPMSRRADPVTSAIAAQQAVAFAGTQCEAIRQSLKSQGPATKTILAERLGIDDVAVARRLADLAAAGLAEPTGAHGRSASGRPERVWRAV